MSATVKHDANHGHRHVHPSVGHVTPMWILIAVWLILMLLTYITVAATYVNFGPTINLVIAMVIATIKATMVVLFFMHLYWDKPFNAVVFIVSLFTVSLLVIWAMMDSTEYKPQLIQGYQPEIQIDANE
ncbi:MAG: cytochrome C oxidase subunit IV family protein [bacterium]|jgi:cytochrome c oxidase subunit 4